jgi:hypothetical protein
MAETDPFLEYFEPAPAFLGAAAISENSEIAPQRRRELQAAFHLTAGQAAAAAYLASIRLKDMDNDLSVDLAIFEVEG